MKEEFFKEIGSQLNHKRLKKGYSLEQVSSSSKIAIKYLTNIEEGEFHKLPGKFYEKSFIKIYARVLRIKDTKLMDIYNKAYDLKSNSINLKEKELDTNNLGFFHTKMPKLSFIVLIFFVFTFMIFFKFFLKNENTSIANIANIENETNNIIPQLDEIYNSNQNNNTVDEIIDLKKDAPIQNTNLNTEDNSLNNNTNTNFYLKQIVAVEDVWIEIKDENENIIIATLLKKDETFKLPNDERLLISTGNAGALEIKNGSGFSKKLGSFGTILRSESIDSLANWSLLNKY